MLWAICPKQQWRGGEEGDILPMGRGTDWCAPGKSQLNRGPELPSSSIWGGPKDEEEMLKKDPKWRGN